MWKKLEETAADLVELNLRVRQKAQGYRAEKSWTPVTAALLLSGIEPSNRWETSTEKGRNARTPTAISQTYLFSKLRDSMVEPERGLDGEMLLPQSVRFENARNILLLWDQICASIDDYPAKLPPKDYVALLLDMNHQGKIHLLEPRWLAVFSNLFELKKPYAHLVIPKDIQTQLEAMVGKKPLLMPKHKLGSHVEKAWEQAVSKGEASTDPDPVLALLAGMIERGEITGIQPDRDHPYSHKTDLWYLHLKQKCTLRRDSLARQMRRLNEKLRNRREIAEPPEQASVNVPFVDRVPVDETAISSFTNAEEIHQLARDLLMEVVQYLRLSCVCPNGWQLAHSVVVGNVVRLTKLLVSINLFAATQLGDMVILMEYLTIGTIVDIKYLIAEFNADTIDKYIRYATEETPGHSGNWGNLDLLQRAKAIGLEKEFMLALETAPRYIHGSFDDSYRFHLRDASEGRYEANVLGERPDPQRLLSISMLALGVARDFLRDLVGGSQSEELRNAVEDLFERLQRADSALEKAVAARQRLMRSPIGKESEQRHGANGQ